ncbi:MAG TPA: hypothetical protein VGL53_30400 [Bryobacteraceae bacterium]
MGVETNLYLIKGPDYHGAAVPALEALLAGAGGAARPLFEKACAVLAEQNRDYPWGRLHQVEGELEFGLSLIDGTAENLLHPDPSISDPGLVRRHHLLDTVCGTVIEGICVPWTLPFPPRHCVTCDSAVWELYQASQRVEYVFTGEIYVRSRKAPFGIAEVNEFLDGDLVQELFDEMSKVSPPQHPRSKLTYFRNLYVLLESACRDGYKIMASYC